MNSIPPIIVRGSAGKFFIAAGLLTFAAVVAPILFFQMSSSEIVKENARKIWPIIALVDMVIIIVGAFFKSRRIYLRDGNLHLSSWFRTSSWPVGDFTDLTLQTDQTSGDNVMHSTSYITVWNQDHVVTRFCLGYWDEAEFSYLLREVVKLNLRIAVAPEVRPYLRA